MGQKLAAEVRESFSFLARIQVLGILKYFAVLDPPPGAERAANFPIEFLTHPTSRWCPSIGATVFRARARARARARSHVAVWLRPRTIFVSIDTVLNKSSRPSPKVALSIKVSRLHTSMMAAHSVAERLAMR